MCVFHTNCYLSGLLAPVLYRDMTCVSIQIPRGIPLSMLSEKSLRCFELFCSHWPLIKKEICFFMFCIIWGAMGFPISLGCLGWLCLVSSFKTPLYFSVAPPLYQLLAVSYVFKCWDQYLNQTDSVYLAIYLAAICIQKHLQNKAKKLTHSFDKKVTT